MMSQNSDFSRRQFLQISGAAALSTLVGCNTKPETIPGVQVGHWSPYNESVVIDGLCSLFDADAKELDSETLALVRQSGLAAINATSAYPGDDFDAANKKLDASLEIINKYSDYLQLITAWDDVLAAKKAQQLGIIWGFQSTEMFGDKLDNITHFANRGVRYMQMSYNGPSQYGDGGLVKENRGLTTLGQAALGVMEANKVLVDLSHSGQRTVAESIAMASRPMTISHTGCNSIYRHPRNNDDAELKAVANKGGVVGIYLMPFLEGGDAEITAAVLLRHLNHAINICGEDQVSIGSDQGVVPVNDGPEYREMVRKDVERRIAAGISAPGETPNRPPFIPELNSARRMELIAWHMHRNGHSDEVIEKVLGRNLLNLYQMVW